MLEAKEAPASPLDLLDVLGNILKAVKATKAMVPSEDMDGLSFTISHTVTSIKDVEKVLEVFQSQNTTKGGTSPVGLERDLLSAKAAFESCLGQLTAALPQSDATYSFSRFLFRNAMKRKDRQRLQSAIQLVNQNVERVLQRLSTKWSSLLRLELAEGMQSVIDQKVETREGIRNLQAQLQDLTQSAREIRFREAIDGALHRPLTREEVTNELASSHRALDETDFDTEESLHYLKGYLRYRIARMRASFASFPLSDQAIKDYRSLPDRGPPKLDPTQGDAQALLDRAIDGLAELSRLLLTPHIILDDIFAALHMSIQALNSSWLYEEADVLNDHAIRLCRAVAASGIPGAVVSLVLFLTYQGAYLRQIGRLEDGKCAAEEALLLSRQLCNVDHDKHVHLLISSLNNLGMNQGDLCDYEASLATLGELVALIRQLGPEYRSYATTLSRALHNQALQKGSIGAYKEALDCIAEAVRLRRTTYSVNPAAHAGSLANSITHLAEYQGANGLHQEALESALEATDLRRQLFHSRPDSFRPYLAESLQTLSTQQAALLRRDEALASAEEALELRQASYELSPEGHRLKLGSAMNNCSLRLQEVGRWEDALASALSANNLYQQQHEIRPNLTSSRGIIESLTHAKASYEALGQIENASEAQLEIEAAEEQQPRYMGTYPQ